MFALALLYRYKYQKVSFGDISIERTIRSTLILFRPNTQTYILKFLSVFATFYSTPIFNIFFQSQVPVLLLPF